MPLVPPYIQNLANYVPGKPIAEVQREFDLSHVDKLASNENSLGPSPKAIKAMAETLSGLHRYPDVSGYELRTKLANRFNIKMKNVILGAGSEGIMSTIIRTFLLQDDELISAANSFIGFRVLANASGRKIHWVPMKKHRYDLEKMIILDEAYFEFAQAIDDYPNSMNYRYDNVITLRTFSKAYGLAGLRIGYGFAHDTLISNLMKVKEPFEPSLIALTAGVAAMDDTEFLKKTIAMNLTGYAFLENELQLLGVEIISSAANFITTVWNSEKRAAEITQSLLHKGIIVRSLTAFGWPEYIRVSIGTETENRRFIDALKTLL